MSITADDVLTGFEVEFDPNDDWDCDEFDEAWEPDWDGDYAEVRSNGGQPLGQQADNLARLVDYLGKHADEMHHDTSCHVHVDLSHIDPDKLAVAYLAHRGEYRALCANERRVRSSWCEPVERYLERRGSYLPFTKYGIPCHKTKGCELSYDGTYNTLEFRLWDATDDLDLYRRRCALLRVIIAEALDLTNSKET